ncbi:MAG TPA: hypothetical protein VFA10_27220 [Ktedonobacteraceae bacterium]|nr:hypothetical protein [Ktedonobacteraceae bacterium]
MGVTVMHWMMVGEVTEAARQQIKNLNGGIMRKIETGALSLYVVGIPCEPLPGHQRDTEVRYHSWTRSREMVIEVLSAHLKLSWISAVDVPPAEASASDTTLDVWREE